MKKLLALALLLTATAFADTSGAFSAPNPSCPPATCSGIGTNSLTFGNPLPTSGNLTFIGNPGSITPGSSYQLGTLNYFNGSIASGSEVNQITLSITTNYNDSSSSLLPLVIGIVNTPNGGVDPVADADYIFFPGYGLGNFHVFEQTGATINFFIDENGDLSITDPSRDGFVTPEPASLALLGTGLLGGLGTLRKKFLNR